MKDLLSLPPECWDTNWLMHVLCIYTGFREALGQETSGQAAAAREGREDPVRHRGYRSGVPEHGGVYARENSAWGRDAGGRTASMENTCAAFVW